MCVCLEASPINFNGIYFPTCVGAHACLSFYFAFTLNISFLTMSYTEHERGKVNNEAEATSNMIKFMG